MTALMDSESRALRSCERSSETMLEILRRALDRVYKDKPE